MSNRWPGGLIRKTPVTPTGPAQTGAAPGVWTIADASYWVKQGLWPTQGLSNNWIGLLRDSGTNSDEGYGVGIDSSGNVYISGRSRDGGSTQNLQLVKFNPYGAVQWQRRLGSFTPTTGEGGIAVDSSGNSYIFGYATISANDQFLLVKYDTNGTIQWQRTLSSPSSDYGTGIVLDSSGNIYVCGTADDTASGHFNMIIAKYNSSGTIQWQRSLSGSGTSSDECNDIAVDGSGNVYVVGYSNNSGTQNVTLAKYNTSGTIQWQRQLDSGGGDFGYGITVDSAGEVYVGGGTTGIAFLARYNTSGTLQWQRQLSAAGFSNVQSVALDGSGGVFVTGTLPVGANTEMLIARYDTSGALQWQRRLGATGTDVGNRIAADSSGNIYVCGYASPGGNNDILVAKLRADGSLTGTYTVGGYSFTYAASSLTDAAASMSSSTLSFTSATSSLTDAASSLTSQSSSLTVSVTGI